MSIYASPYDPADDGGMPDELPRTISLERSFAALYGLQNSQQQQQQQQQRKFRGWSKMGSFFGSSNSNASSEASRRGSAAGSSAEVRKANAASSLLRTVSLPSRAAALKAQQQQQQQQQTQRAVRSAEEEERERQRQIEMFGTVLADDVPLPPPGFEYDSDFSPDRPNFPPPAVAAPPSPPEAAEGQEYGGGPGADYEGTISEWEGGSSDWEGSRSAANGAAAGGGGGDLAEYRPRAAREFRRTTSSPVPKCPPASAPVGAAGARDRRLAGDCVGATLNGPFSSGEAAGGGASMGGGISRSGGTAGGCRTDDDVRVGGGGVGGGGAAPRATSGTAGAMGTPSRASGPFVAPPAASSKPPVRSGFGRSTSVTQTQGNAAEAAPPADVAGSGGGDAGGGRRGFRRAMSMELRPRARANRAPLALNPLDASPPANSAASAFPRPPVPWAAADDPCSPSAPLPAPQKQPPPYLPASSSPLGRPPPSSNHSARGWAAWTQADEASPRAAFAPPFLRSSSVGGPSPSSLRNRELPPPAPPYSAHPNPHAGIGAWAGAGGGGMGAAAGGGYGWASPGSQRSLSPERAEANQVSRTGRGGAAGGQVGGGDASEEDRGGRRAQQQRAGAGGSRARVLGERGRWEGRGRVQQGGVGRGSVGRNGLARGAGGLMGTAAGPAWEEGSEEAGEESPREVTVRCAAPSMHSLLRLASHSRHRSLDASPSSASPSGSPVPLARPVSRPAPPASARSPARLGAWGAGGGAGRMGGSPGREGSGGGGEEEAGVMLLRASTLHESSTSGSRRGGAGEAVRGGRDRWGGARDGGGDEGYAAPPVPTPASVPPAPGAWGAAGGAGRVGGSPGREGSGGGGEEEAGVMLLRASTLHESSASSSRRGGSSSAWHAERQAEAGGQGSGAGGGGAVQMGGREARRGLVRSASGVEPRHCRNRSAGGGMSIGATGSVGVAASSAMGPLDNSPLPKAPPPPAAGQARVDVLNPRRGLVRSASGVEARHRRERSGGGSSSSSGGGAGMGWLAGGMGAGEQGEPGEEGRSEASRAFTRSSSGVEARHRRQRSSGAGSTGGAGGILSSLLSRPGAAEGSAAGDRDAGEGKASGKGGGFGLVRMATMERRRSKGRSNSVVDDSLAASPFQDLSWD
ncbi:unnamed protein product [Closterium sp. NIES-53]